MTQTDNNQPAPETRTEPDQREQFILGIEADLRRLRMFSSRGLWAFSLFIMVCMMAWHNFPILPSADSVVASLGKPPSAQTISFVLLIYTFSAIILSLSRMMGGIEHKSSFCHVGYLTGFFLFYYFAKALDENYWAVFGSGVTILGVESYRIWTFCNETIAKKTEQLQYVRKTGRLPIEE